MNTTKLADSIEIFESLISSVLILSAWIERVYIVQLTLPKLKSRKSKVYFKSSFLYFYRFRPHISQIFSKSKLFLQSQWIRLRQS